MKIRLCLIFLVGCGGFKAPPPRPESRHTCDPKGNTDEPVRVDPEPYLARELDADELALVTLCRVPEAAQQPDAALVERCSKHAEQQPPTKRSSCRHACMAQARSEAARFATSNVLRGLGAIARLRQEEAPALDKCMAMFAKGTPEAFQEVHDGRDLWNCLGLPALPSDFVLDVVHARTPRIARLIELGVRGSMPALPMHEWRVSLVDHGCGVSRWNVVQRAPRVSR